MANKYDWKITVKKAAIILLEILICGGISYFTEQPLFIGLVPILEAARNFIKNFNLK